MSHDVHHAINDEALDTIFREARTQNKWQNKPVSPALLMAIYDLMRWGPTSANMSPARIVFVVSKEAKARLKPFLSEGNLEKTLAAPATAIIGYDLQFAEHLPKLFPHAPDAKNWFQDPAAVKSPRSETARCKAPISSSPRARWVWIAGRCRASTMRASTANFFPAARSSRIFSAMSAMAIRADCFPASPRLSFDEACQIL